MSLHSHYKFLDCNRNNFNIGKLFFKDEEDLALIKVTYIRQLHIFVCFCVYRLHILGSREVVEKWSSHIQELFLAIYRNCFDLGILLSFSRGCYLYIGRGRCRLRVPTSR